VATLLNIKLIISDSSVLLCHPFQWHSTQ